METFLRQLRPARVDEGLRLRLERALLAVEDDEAVKNAEEGQLVQPPPGTWQPGWRVWAPVAAAAGLVLFFGLPRPSGADSSRAAGSSVARAGAAAAAPGSSAALNPSRSSPAPAARPLSAQRRSLDELLASSSRPATSPPPPQFRPGLDRALANRHARAAQRRDVGRFVGLQNEGTRFDENGRPWRQMRWRVDNQVQDQELGPSGGTRRGQMARERVLRVPVPMY